MLITLSPAKTLDFEKQQLTKRHSTPVLLKDSHQLVKCLREYSAKELSELMGISPDLAELNRKRFGEWHTPFTVSNAKQAVLAFRGHAYLGLNAVDYSADDFKFAQDHLRILSGLYGVLRPLDLIQAYRLEMGTKLETSGVKNLYEFWGTKITDTLNADLKKSKDKVLVNLASNEYFKSVQPKLLDARVVTPVFKENKGGTCKVVSVFAKKARGLMSSYIIQNRLTDVEGLRAFDVEGYRFSVKLSSENEWVFARKPQ